MCLLFLSDRIHHKYIIYQLNRWKCSALFEDCATAVGGAVATCATVAEGGGASFASAASAGRWMSSSRWMRKGHRPLALDKEGPLVNERSHEGGMVAACGGVWAAPFFLPWNQADLILGKSGQPFFWPLYFKLGPF